MKWILSLMILGYLLRTPLPSEVSNAVIGEPRSLTTELRPYYDISTLPSYLDHTYSAQTSSYDTTGGNDDGFSGTYSYLRRNPDSSLVIFEAHGAGVIHRIWTPTPSDDTLDFYIDNIDRPSFTIKYSDLFSGNQYPFIAPLCGNQLGGFYCYLPIPFSKNCKIVFRGKKTQFHQIQYRLYKSPQEVKPFSLVLNNEEKAALQKIATFWNSKNKSIKDFYSTSILRVDTTVDLRPNQAITLFRSNQGGRILGFEIEPSAAFEGLSKNVDLKITWDDEKVPAVYCPVADFFGYAFGTSSMQSLLMGTQDSKNYCYVPMPYDRSASIALIYRGQGGKVQPALKLKTHIYFIHQPRKTTEGKFYTQWNKKTRSDPGRPHVFAAVTGRGHYIGSILQAQGLKPGMTYFFEGDDSTAIDGAMRLHGTGSEDYFNGGWYAMLDRWEGRMSLPLHGALDYSLPFCRTGGYRFYLGDKLSFEQSFFHSIEHGPSGNAVPVDYTSLGMYYADSPPLSFIQPTASNSTVYLPDTMIIYPQLMDYNVFGNMDIKTSWKYGTGGESYLFTPTNASWLRISLKDIPEGRYKMYVDHSLLQTGCTFSIWQRQSLISSWSSTYNHKEERISDKYIAAINVSTFESTLTLRFKVESERNQFLLHRIKLVKV